MNAITRRVTKKQSRIEVDAALISSMCLAWGEGQHYDAIDIMGYTCLEDGVIFPSYSGNQSIFLGNSSPFDR